MTTDEIKMKLRDIICAACHNGKVDDFLSTEPYVVDAADRIYDEIVGPLEKETRKLELRSDDWERGSTKQQDKIAELQAKLSKAREALKPFANDCYYGYENIKSEHKAKMTIPISYLHRAKRAYEETK